MMKKIIYSLFAVALLAAFDMQAKKKTGCDPVFGSVLINPGNANRVPAYTGTSIHVTPFATSVLKGTGFTTSGQCLTIRPLGAFVTAAGATYRSFTEVIAQIHVAFPAGAFVHPPIVTASLNITKPLGTGCPLVAGGSEILDPSGNPLGYINTNFIYLTNITIHGFVINFDLQLALVSDTAVQAVVKGLIGLNVAFDFHAIAA